MIMIVTTVEQAEGWCVPIMVTDTASPHDLRRHAHHTAWPKGCIAHGAQPISI